MNKEEKLLLKNFYEERRIADYILEARNKKEVETYIYLVKKLFEVVQDD